MHGVREMHRNENRAGYDQCVCLTAGCMQPPTSAASAGPTNDGVHFKQVGPSFGKRELEYKCTHSKKMLLSNCKILPFERPELQQMTCSHSRQLDACSNDRQHSAVISEYVSLHGLQRQFVEAVRCLMVVVDHAVEVDNMRAAQSLQKNGRTSPIASLTFA